ncbi:MAG: hypothetical protein ABIV47_02275 [Roseiflexaceae bacterium]
MTHMIVFTLGYFLGGLTSMLLLGLAVAARRGERGRAERVQFVLERRPRTEDE